MAGTKDCPKCRLVNPPSAQRCDCGYDFATRSVEQSYVAPKENARPDAGPRVVGYGCLVLAPFLLICGACSAVGAANAGLDTPTGLGMLCGSFLPGLGALGMAVHLLRRRR